MYPKPGPHSDSSTQQFQTGLCNTLYVYKLSSFLSFPQFSPPILDPHDYVSHEPISSTTKTMPAATVYLVATPTVQHLAYRESTVYGRLGSIGFVKCRYPTNLSWYFGWLSMASINLAVCKLYVRTVIISQCNAQTAKGNRVPSDLDLLLACLLFFCLGKINWSISCTWVICRVSMYRKEL